MMEMDKKRSILAGRLNLFGNMESGKLMLTKRSVYKGF